MTGMSNVTKLAGEPSGQEFLVFTLGDEEYGIDILKVQEIRGYDQVTRIANTPAFIKGVTNLRGVIVPIVDLRVKFSQSDVDYNCIDSTKMIQKEYPGLDWITRNQMRENSELARD